MIRALDPADGAPPLDRLMLGFAEEGSVLWSILRALAPGIHCGRTRMTGLDPKDGMELFPGRSLFSH